MDEVLSGGKIGIKLQVEFVFGGVDQVLLDLDSGLRIQDRKKTKNPMQNEPTFRFNQRRKEKDGSCRYAGVNQRVTGIE